MSELDEVTALKGRHHATWAAGDYPDVARYVAEVGVECAARADIGEGMDVLDVAAGTGNASIPAAQRGARVIGLDLTPELFDAARERAAEAGVEVEWVAGDAEALPFEDASFDRVLSAIGVQFAPRHEVVASELARVCRPGGRIVLANWTREGMIGELFKLMGRYLPKPPPWVSPPPLWGDSEHVRRLFAEATRTMPTFERRTMRMPFASPEAYVAYFEGTYGPTIKARELLEPQGQWAELRDEFVALAASFWRGGAVEQEYAIITVPR